MRNELRPFICHLGTTIAISAILLQFAGCLTRREEEQDSQQSELADPATNPGRTVRLQKEQIERLQIATTQATLAPPSNTLNVFGRVIPNPNATYDIFAPYSGELVVDSKWPVIAATAMKGDVIGSIKVRISPEIVGDLRSRLMESESRLPSDLEAVESLSKIVQGLQPVANKQILSRTELDAAMANLAKAQAQVASDRSIISSLGNTIAEAEVSDKNPLSHWRIPIVLSQSGQVTELFVSTSSFVEAGQQLARIVDPSKQMVRIEIPPTKQIEFQRSKKEISVTVGKVEIKGRYLGMAGEVSPSSQFHQHLFEFSDEAGSLRPGQVVRGRLDLEPQEVVAKAASAVEMPATALLYHQGMPFVFVRTTEEEFQRRGVQLLDTSETRIIVQAASDTSLDLQIGVGDGEQVVTSGAQVLLSRQFLQSGGDDD